MCPFYQKREAATTIDNVVYCAIVMVEALKCVLGIFAQFNIIGPIQPEGALP